METSDFKNCMVLIKGSNTPFLPRKKLQDFKILQLVYFHIRSDQKGKVFCKSV